MTWIASRCRAAHPVTLHLRRACKQCGKRASSPTQALRQDAPLAMFLCPFVLTQVRSQAACCRQPTGGKSRQQLSPVEARSDRRSDAGRQTRRAMRSRSVCWGKLQRAWDRAEGDCQSGQWFRGHGGRHGGHPGPDGQRQRLAMSLRPNAGGYMMDWVRQDARPTR